MMHWNDGYVSDIPYTGGIYQEQMPSHLDAVCLVAGVAPAVDPGKGFNYCELGCGIGESAMVIAAAYPQANVWGFDFNPAHIVQGRASAEDAGLDNITFAERSFEEMAQAAPDKLPSFDYVTAHGVWSWISPANRAHIVAFLRRFLRPGGVFSVSYNTLPGWAGSIALQHLLLQAGRRSWGASDVRIGEALALTRRVANAGSFALDSKQVERLEAMLAKGASQYLCHEYLNEHWAPAFHADVVDAVAPAKLSYVASANMLENFPTLCMSADQHALLESLPGAMSQTVQDFFCPRHFRRDVFARGPRRLSARERRQRGEAQGLALIVPPQAVTCKIKVPIGEATLNPAFYEPALVALEGGNKTVGELLGAAAPGTAPVPEEVLGMLVGSNQVLAMRTIDDVAALQRVRRFNRARIATAIGEGEATCFVASLGLVFFFIY